MKKILLIITVKMALLAGLQAKIVTKEVEYSDGEVKLKGFMAWDDSIKGKRPGVLLVHEWWGQNDFVRGKAKEIAKLGYIGFALDMYGEGKMAKHPDDAGKFSKALTENLDLMKKRFLAAYDFIKKDAKIDPGQTAAMGYCFGGGVVLQMAREGVAPIGVISFHGNLASAKKAEKGKVNSRILVFTGGDDPFVPEQVVQDFRNEMNSADAEFQLVSYKGVKHSFTVPNADKIGEEFILPMAYSEGADKNSWKMTVDFLAEIFN